MTYIYVWYDMDPPRLPLAISPGVCRNSFIHLHVSHSSFIRFTLLIYICVIWYGLHRGCYRWQGLVCVCMHVCIYASMSKRMYLYVCVWMCYVCAFYFAMTFKVYLVAVSMKSGVWPWLIRTCDITHECNHVFHITQLCVCVCAVTQTWLRLV